MKHLLLLVVFIALVGCNQPESITGSNFDTSEMNFADSVNRIDFVDSTCSIHVFNTLESSRIESGFDIYDLDRTYIYKLIATTTNKFADSKYQTFRGDDVIYLSFQFNGTRWQVFDIITNDFSQLDYAYVLKDDTVAFDLNDYNIFGFTGIDQHESVHEYGEVYE